MSKRLIIVVGKTSSGKDTVAKYIKDAYNIPMVVSYTTRGMRDYEIDGVQHYFVSKERMKEIVDTEDIIAYTKFPKTEIEYCATADSIKGDVAVYILNPDGVDWFKKNGSGVDCFSIYVDLSEDLILERAKLRGDSLDNIVSRLDSEREEFDKFKETKGYSYFIDNSGTYEDLISHIDSIMESKGFKKVKDYL